LAATKSDGRTGVHGSGTVPCTGFAKGAVTDVAALAAAIREAVDCALMVAAVPHEAIHLGIGGLDITALNSIGSIVPASGTVTGADVEKACRAATIVAVPDDQRVLHVLPIGFWLDGRPESEAPLGQKGGRLEVETHIVSAPRPLLDELIAALSAKRLTVVSVFANAVAGAAAVADSPSCLVMDMGAGLTDIALYSGGKIVLSASVPLGGDYVTSDIMQGLGISRLHAEEIKRYYAKLARNLYGREIVLDCNDYGTTDKNVEYDFLHKIIESRVEEIVALLYAYVEPALARYGAEKILLTGGSSLLPSVGEWTGRIFARSVQLARPGADLPEEYTHPSLAAGVGLVEYAARQLPAEREGGSLRSFFNKIKQYV
jgi:cell division protein FtsA